MDPTAPVMRHEALAPDDATADVPVVENAPTRRRPFYRRRLVIGVVAAVLAAGAGIGTWLAAGSSSEPGLIVTTQLVTVTTGTMRQTVSASGTIEPAQEADLNFAVSGQVTAVDVSTGQTVTAGQTLATIDPSALQAQLASAQASLAGAQAKLSSDEAASAPTSQIDADEVQVNSAQTALNSAETNLSDASLTSTIAGIVASVDLTVGEQVSGGGSGGGSGGSSGSSSTQIVVISTTSYVVNTTVDDTEVGQVKTGDQVDITPSGSNSTVYGTVSSVGLIASGGSGVASFPVGVAVTGSPSGLYAGASASLAIIVQQIDNAIEVPTAAISYSPNGEETVTVVDDGRHVNRDITTGESSGGETQVTSGLTAGEQVLEQVVTFNGTPAGGAHRLLGGGGTSVSGGFPSGVPVFRKVIVNGGPGG